MSAINAQYKAKFQGRVGKTCGAFSRDFYYQFLNCGFNKYRFHAKIPIEGNEDLISAMEAKLK